MRPISIPDFILEHDRPKNELEMKLGDIRRKIDRLAGSAPEVTIIIPAFNEEKNILKTVSSLAASRSSQNIEIIVVDNNSTDLTKKLVGDTGAICIQESRQSIGAARNAGLAIARGRFILNADADTIYPPDWVDYMIKPLVDDGVGLVYGSFAFLPTAGTPRFVYFGYEYLSDFIRWINRKFREEAVNIYGSNSAFRRDEGLQVDGFDHPDHANEDGWLALKLRERFGKKLFRIKESQAIVWTSDRRILLDGGLLKASIKRVKRNWYF